MVGPRLRGRHWVAAGLAAFLAVSLTVVWRQSAALDASRRLQALSDTLGALEAQRSEALGRIRRARSRAELIPLARSRLGLRLPQDSEITILQVPGPH